MVKKGMFYMGQSQAMYLNTNLYCHTFLKVALVIFMGLLWSYLNRAE